MFTSLHYNFLYGNFRALIFWQVNRAYCLVTGKVKAVEITGSLCCLIMKILIKNSDQL